MEEAHKSETRPQGWPAALLMFHLSMWRERLRNGLADVAAGREYTPPPSNIDEVNDRELSDGIGTPLTDGAARSDLLLGEIIELYARVGDAPFAWSVAKTTTEAVLRNSYIHPRIHMFEYLTENGQPERAAPLFEDAVTDLRAASAPALSLGAAVYNLACLRAGQGRTDEALDLIAEALELRPEMREHAAADPDLEALRGTPRFQEIVSS